MKTVWTVLFTLMAVITAMSVFVAVFQSDECVCPEPTTETQTSEQSTDRTPIASSAAIAAEQPAEEIGAGDSGLLNVLRTIITITVMILLISFLW
ncbi:MAG: hypothetical protein OXG09_00060, partial [Chloroflexi bacterium]|nr:hypothetical protein [Chloroflexota bacterium]